MPQDLPNPRGADQAGKPFELTGKHVLAMFIAFFVVVASVNGYMMRQAITTMPGLEARNGYDVSQRFNARIAEAHAQDVRGWIADAAIRNEAGRILASVELKDHDGKPLDGLAVFVRLEHPSTKAQDKTLALGPDAPGLYSGASAGRADGVWTVVIEARSASGDLVYQSRNRTLLKG